MQLPHIAIAILLFCAPALAGEARPDDLFNGTVALEGLLPVHVDEKAGRILLTLPAPDVHGVTGRYLYTPSLRTGLGSAPTQLDRGRVGRTQVLSFRRLGRKIAAVFENPRFRAGGAADAASPDFASSTVWMTDVVATLPGGAVVIDIASFLLNDSVGVAAGLAQENAVDNFVRGPGQFRLEKTLSAADLSSVKLFPLNLEVDAVQTFVSDKPGSEVSNIAPESKNVSFVVHHSLAALPPPGFTPRAFDPRIGGFATQAVDYTRPLGHDVVFDVANRFRLEKTDPAAQRSTVKKPIVFYIDRATPEPMRSALVEGVSWWAKAFEDAGYIDAFRAEVMPEGMDPMDIRYNVVHWVDRATRGWAYGQAITDPRTGEIVKGMVVIGSERLRQNIEIFKGLVGAAATGGNDPARAGLARMRQLAAHEVGHTLGFAHNFAASTQDRASVMDYPPPRVGIKDGALDLSDAYGTGLGAWDRATVDWLYGEPTQGSDAQGFLDAKAAAAAARLRYGRDEARPADSALAWSAVWDDGADPVAELSRVMAVRSAALQHFGLGTLSAGEPVANLRRRFVPVYLFHRYQLVAASKLIGGAMFTYAAAGSGPESSAPVPAARQREAIAAVLDTVAPAQLRVPAALSHLLSVPRNGSGNLQFAVEVFQSAGNPVFDPLVAADVAVEIALNTLLAPARLQRMEVQHTADRAFPGVTELLDTIEKRIMVPRTDALARRIIWRAVVTMAQTARHSTTTPEIAAFLGDRVHSIAEDLARRKGDAEERAWAAQLSRDLLNPETLETIASVRSRVTEIPQGDPIGESDWLGSAEY